ncbi:glycerophosphodiester phosphodiesterase [Paenibacillus spongiae]|uniref:Glycerophosphodiester phosphodiesterase n=1 Tax=Paenibacillus spongiae TaxID=2909671 RepID=A0ABY5SHF7_9BACL|nr:glycerophosphodiester phosphodiesterase family protein [Paenibacillus spongiae]UVI32900.1 glycerophosphodiester phosphodiesterase [Paenibacillus spongiae]
MTTIVAHRGWSGAAPENTLAAFKLALSDADIACIELDVHLSKDGVPVVIHDHTLDRTTNGTGFVQSLTYEELRSLDAGSWYAPQYHDEKLPTLEEVLLLTKGRCRLAVELKKIGNMYEGIEQKVIDLILRYEMKEQVVLSSFDHDSMKKVNEIDSSFMTGLIFLGNPTLLLEQLQYTGARSISIHHAFITKALMDQMTEHGIDVGVWTVDDTAIMARMMDLYPAARITTNYPDRLLNLIRGEAALR